LSCGPVILRDQRRRSQLTASRSNWRRPFAAFLTLWLLLSPTGFVDAVGADHQSLLEASADYARAFDLRPGVTLSPAQIAGLAHDLVWLEERLVEGQRVLVPVVYLAQQGEATDTRASGTLITNASATAGRASAAIPGSVRSRPGRLSA